MTVAKTPKTIEQEASALITHIKEKAGSSASFSMSHEALKEFVALDEFNAYDETRVKTVLQPMLRRAGISCSAHAAGYNFNITRKAPVATSPVSSNPTLSVANVGEEAADKAISTMTQFGNRFIAPSCFRDVSTMVEHGLQVLLVGPPGCGKSRMLEEIARLAGIHSMRRQMSSIPDPEVLVGTIQVVTDPETKHSVTKFVPGSLSQAVENGWLFIGDEYDNATAAVNESLKMISEHGGTMVVETERGVKVIPKHPKFRLGFTANTWCRGDASGDFPNAQPQNSASLDRIDAMINIDYDVDVERAVMADFGIPNHIIEQFYGKNSADPAKTGLIIQIRTALQTNEVRGDLGLRKIMAFSKLYPLFGWHKAFLYGILNKFEPEDHGHLTKVISSKYGTDMIPTDDANVIAKASASLQKWNLFSK